jgi:hypothetical protein
MRWLIVGLVGALCAAGCGGRKSSLLLERQAKGPIEEEAHVAKGVRRSLAPVLQTQAKGGIEAAVNYASPEYQRNFFANKTVFGSYAGKSPYFPEHLVFYVKLANTSEKKIKIDPKEFVLVDDRGNQYSTVGTDYVTAFAESRSPIASTTRGVLEEARPGYFGFSLPVGKMVATKPQGQFALLQQSALQTGYVYPGVTHDGLIAFWSPSTAASKVRLLLTNIKTDFGADDLPKTALEFLFEFDVSAE